MDIRKLFRSLVTKEFMPDYAYGTILGFKTVFYTSAFSYKCCPCAFEHEFLLYIDRDGHINEEIYQKLEQSIVDGKCPHVDLVDSKWIQESTTSSLHIAFAAGTEEVVNDTLEADIMLYFSCGLFQLKLFDIAFMKTRLESFDGSVHCPTLPPFGEDQTENWIQRHLKYIQGGHDKVNVICCDSSEILNWFTIKELNMFEMACGIKNEKMLEHILQSTYCSTNKLIHAINYVMEHELKELEDCFLDFVKKEEGSHSVVGHFIEAAIVYNRPDSMEKMIGIFAGKQQRMLKMIDKRALFRISNVNTRILNRDRCKSILERYKGFSSQRLSGTKQICELFYLLKWFGESCKNEVLTALRQVKDFQKECIDYIDRNLGYIVDTPSLVQDILSLGVDIFDGDTEPDHSWFSQLLQQLNFYFDKHVPDMIRTLIGANPDLDQQDGVVELAFLQDELMYKMEQNRYNHGNRRSPLGTYSYVTDMQEHGVFGLDDLHFARNFAGPLLLECGFPATMDQLEKALDMNLHPAEHEYIKNNIHGRLEGPKCLLIACRETLRKNFRGLKLHRFLEYSKCPKKIKDFVLMKALVQSSQRKC